MKNHIFNLQLTAIMVQDPKIGGFTAYFKQFPNIIAEGDSDGEAMNNLMNAVHDVFNHQGKEEARIMDSHYKIIEKPVNFVANERS